MSMKYTIETVGNCDLKKAKEKNKDLTILIKLMMRTK